MKLYQQDELILEAADKCEAIFEMLTYDNNQFRVNGEQGVYGSLTPDLKDFEVEFSLRGGGGNVPFSKPVWFADIDQLFDAVLADSKHDFWVD